MVFFLKKNKQLYSTAVQSHNARLVILDNFKLTPRKWNNISKYRFIFTKLNFKVSNLFYTNQLLG